MAAERYQVLSCGFVNVVESRSALDALCAKMDSIRQAYQIVSHSVDEDETPPTFGPSPWREQAVTNYIANRERLDRERIEREMAERAWEETVG